MKKADVEVRRQFVLTISDNDVVDNVCMYPHRRKRVQREKVVGLVKCYIPMIGRINLLTKDDLETSYVVLTATFVIEFLP